MTNLSNAQNQFPDFIYTPAFLSLPSNQKEKERAAFAQLASTLQAVLKTLPEETASTAQPTSIPSDYEMQESIGQLMALLTDLQGLIAKLGTQNNQANATVGQALVTEMQAQVKKASDQLQNKLKDQSQQDFWSTFTKVVEGIVGAIVTGIALLCGQPELAIITLAFTVLALSGGMDKMTKGLSDVLSKALVDIGVPKEEADAIAKVLADVIIIVASIVVTVATCGAGGAIAGQVLAETAAEEGTEMAEIAGSQAGEAAAEAAPEAVEASDSFAQKVGNFFENVANKIKTNNPFNKIPKNWNLGIVAGAQAAGSTNFGQDFMASVLVHMKDKNTKQILETTLGILISLLTALAGAGAGISVASGPSFYSFSNITKPMVVLTGLQVAAGTAQVSGEVGLGVTYGELASNIDGQGETQSLLTMLQALVRMNSGQADADTKALGSKMKAWGSEIAALSHNLNAAEAAVARELQA